ncbi:MAG TPA: GNAT family N-acetyltransferase, partial [Ktedonobacteraceae bacterium]|nr:GNAT family N-acetyltransferase [Ktedonobacteraceae bacterium]
MVDTGNTENTEVRRARPDDRDAVLAFCANTWEWGDYIEYVWDEWLYDPQGALFVATIDGQPVGLAHMHMVSATEAWLEGMRVDPNFRHRGLSKALSEAMMIEAMSRGATTARLATESTNIASITLAEHGHMRRIGSFALHNAEPVTTPSKRQYGMDAPQVATEADLDDIIDFLNASSNFPLTGGMYYHSFIGYAITGALLAEKIAAQQVYILRRWQRLDGLAIAEPRHGRQGAQLSIGYIDGTTESISMIAYTLRTRVVEMGLESVNAYVPDLIMIRDAFIGAEYTWSGNVFYTY